MEHSTEHTVMKTAYAIIKTLNKHLS